MQVISSDRDARRMIAHECVHIAQVREAFIDQIVGQYARKGDRVRFAHPTTGGTTLFVNRKLIGTFLAEKQGLVFRAE